MTAVALGSPLADLDTWCLLARDGTRIRLTEEARAAVRDSRAVVERTIASGAVVYGVNTGFGKLANVRIAADQLQKLQRNLLLSHAAGVGDPLPRDVARLALALRIQALALGCSGVRPEVLDAMIALYNSGLVPVVPA